MHSEPGSENLLSLPSVPFECVEVYVPKTLENVAKLYRFLETKLIERKQGLPQRAVIEGFSLYEVDGAFYGHEIYQERTIVVRLLLRHESSEDHQMLAGKIQVLGQEIAASVAMNEEELWICHFPQGVVIFRPRTKSECLTP